MMTESGRVTPWYNDQEWLQVYHCVKSNSPAQISRAVEQIKIWQARSDRLPAGVETSLCLLEGALATASSDPWVHLTASTCVNRFLNLASHTGFHLLGLTKYYDVARMFHIPEWVVDVRHETTHGHLPSRQVLLDALAFCLEWVRANYWDAEFRALTAESPRVEEGEGVMGDVRDTEAFQSLHNALDAYQYLKIYTIWGGVDHVSDLEDQEELYDHVVGLLSGHDSVRKRFHGDVRSVKIREAANIARSAVHSFLAGMGGGGGNKADVVCKEEVLVENLVGAELMMPAREFLQSLCADQAEKEKWSDKKLLANESSGQQPVSLPDNLVKVWADVIQMMAATHPHLVGRLLSRLYQATASDDVYDKSVATSWVLELCEAVEAAFAKVEKPSSTPKSSPWKASKRSKKNSSLNSSKNTEEHSRSIVRLHSSDALKAEMDKFCRHVINNPTSTQSLALLPKVSQFLGLSGPQVSQVRTLMEVHLGLKTIAEVEKCEGVKTVSDLSVCGDDVDMCTSSDDDDGGAWSVCKADFKDVAFGECPGSDNLSHGLQQGDQDSIAFEDSREDVQFLTDFDKSDIVLVNWAEVRQKPVLTADPTASPFSGSVGSSGPTSAVVTSDEEEEGEEGTPPRPLSKAKPLKRVLQLDNVPAFYRNTAVHKTVRKNGRKRKIVVSSDC